MSNSAESAFRAALESISGLKNYHDKGDAKRIAAEVLAAHPPIPEPDAETWKQGQADGVRVAVAAHLGSLGVEP